jgi:hypothetical protein
MSCQLVTYLVQGLLLSGPSFHLFYQALLQLVSQLGLKLEQATPPSFCSLLHPIQVKVQLTKQALVLEC